MNVYQTLKIEIPILGYLIFHQTRAGVTPENYQKTMQELHRRIQQEARKIDSVIRTGTVRFIQSSECRVRNDVRLPPTWDGLIQNGKDLLQTAGLAPAGELPIYTSSFIVKSSVYLDILEHIVRDRVGIYGSIHGRHIGEFQQYGYALQNLVYENAGKTEKTGKRSEISLFFSKPKMKYEAFRRELSEGLDEVESILDLSSLLLWQRKLGLGVGKEFELRAVLPEGVDSLISFLEECKKHLKDDSIRLNLFSAGHLLVKERLW